MGLSFALTGFPIFVLIISTLIGGAGIAGAIGDQGFSSNPNNLPTTDCSNFVGGVNSCLAVLPTNGIITCSSPALGLPCVILIGCSNPPSPLYCATSLGATRTLLDAGQTVTITNGQVSSTSSSVVFAFGTITSQGLVFAIIGVAVAVAAIVGLNVFGSGESSEAIHVLLMGGVFLGIWAFFSGLEGFVAGSPTSFFTQLNSAYANLGTTTYAILSLVFMMSWVRTVSRGS